MLVERGIFRKHHLESLLTRKFAALFRRNSLVNSAKRLTDYGTIYRYPGRARIVVLRLRR